MAEITFRVDGHPKGQPRPRAFSRKGGPASVYDPGTADGWKMLLVLAGRRRRPAVPISGAVCITLLFEMPRPARLNRKSDPDGPVPCLAKPDADNLAKAVLDAMTQEGWWRDDAQVTELRVQKMYCGKVGRPGCVVTLAWTPPAE